MIVNPTALLSNPHETRPLLLKYIHDPETRRLAIGTIWRLCASVGGQAARLLCAICLARLLGRTAFGQLSILQNTIGLLTSLASISLGTTVIKHVAEYRDSDKRGAGRMIGFAFLTIGGSGLLIACTALVLSNPIATRALNAPELTISLQLLSLDVLFNSLESVQTGTLLGLEAFRASAILANAKNFLLLPVMVAGALLRGINGAIVGQLLVDAAFVAIAASTLRKQCAKKEIPIRFEIRRSDWGTVKNFSLPVFLTSMLNWLGQWCSNAVLSRRPNGFSQFAVFQVGRQWGNLVNLVPAAMGDAGLPILSNLFGTGRYTTFVAAIRRQYLIVLRISIAAAICVSLASPLILSAYGKSFRNHYGPIVILSICGVCQALTSIPLQVIASIGKMWSGFWFTLGFSVILVASTLVLVQYGSGGLSFAYLLAYIVDLVMLTIFVKRAIGTISKRDAPCAS